MRAEAREAGKGASLYLRNERGKGLFPDRLLCWKISRGPSRIPSGRPVTA